MAMDDLIPFGSPHYFLFLALLAFGRGMDFLSTWIATPNLVLEANPLAKRLGWKGGLIMNALICLGFAVWPLPALIIVTTSLLVASRNLQNAWLMRSLGEETYRIWFIQRVVEVKLGLYCFCLLLQTALLASIGGALMYFGRWNLVPFAVGMGIITYAVAIVVFTLLSVWRIRRSLA
jgi:hypothetical protein